MSQLQQFETHWWDDACGFDLNWAEMGQTITTICLRYYCAYWKWSPMTEFDILSFKKLSVYWYLKVNLLVHLEETCPVAFFSFFLETLLGRLRVHIREIPYPQGQCLVENGCRTLCVLTNTTVRTPAVWSTWCCALCIFVSFLDSHSQYHITLPSFQSIPLLYFVSVLVPPCFLPMGVLENPALCTSLCVLST